MRVLILDAAKSIFIEKGYDSTSMRDIAKRIEYSPTTIYLYFRGKDEIFQALREEGFRHLWEIIEITQSLDNPFERLKAICFAYLKFIENDKYLFDLMFIKQLTTTSKEQDKPRLLILEYFKNVIKECKAQGHFKGSDVEYVSFATWSMVHGMWTLFRYNHCQVYNHLEPKEFIRHTYENFIAMLEKL